jgi:hypothetical protein
MNTKLYIAQLIGKNTADIDLAYEEAGAGTGREAQACQLYAQLAVLDSPRIMVKDYFLLMRLKGRPSQALREPRRTSSQLLLAK